MYNKIQANRVKSLVRSIVFRFRETYRSKDAVFDSDKDFAAYLNLTPAQFSRIASGVCVPSSPVLLSILKLFFISFDGSDSELGLLISLSTKDYE